MDWTDLGTWVDIIGTVVGGAQAKEQSDAALDLNDLKELFMYQNPNTPFTTMSEVNGRPEVSWTPEVQQLADSFFAQLGSPRTPYSSSPGIEGLRDSSINYQRSRHGLGAVDNTGRFDARPPVESGSGIVQDEPPLDYGNIGSSPGQPGNSPGAVQPDPTQPGTLQPNYPGYGGTPGTGGSWGQFANDLFQNDLINQPSDGRPFDFQEFLEQFQPQVGTESGLWAAENADWIGRAVGGLSGIPGGVTAGRMLGNYFGDRYLDNNVFRSPVDENDPWGVEAERERFNELFPGFNTPETALANPVSGRAPWAGGSQNPGFSPLQPGGPNRLIGSNPRDPLQGMNPGNWSNAFTGR